MIAFVKSRGTFKNTHKLEVTEYNYCIDSAYENISVFQVAGEYSGLEDDFIIFEEHFGVISSCQPENGITTIQSKRIVTLFDRQLVLIESEEYIEDFMKRVIEEEFKGLDDAAFAMPYISVAITSHTPYSHPVNTSGIWQLEKYISRVKRLFDIYTDITYDDNTLRITIGKKTVPNHNVDFNSSDFQLIQETYSSNAISKISVVGEGEITDYYLFDDGSYGTDPEAGERVRGKWEFRETSENIGYVFASNSDSHLIQFRSFRRFGFGDRITTRINGRVTYSYINQILRDSADDRYLYKTGDVTNTAADTISELLGDVDEIQQELEFNTLKSDRDGSITGKLEVSGDIYEGGVKLSDKYAGGSSFSGSYNDLNDKPQINSITLINNKTLDDLNIQVKGNYADTILTNLEIDALLNND